MDIDITICNSLKATVPELRLGCLDMAVEPGPSPAPLLATVQATIEEITGSIVVDDIRDLPAIQAAKTAYRALGKDPSRYRPSAEALTRRVVSGKGLCRINNIVDVLNLVSIKYGFSIGGYDRKAIEGAIEMAAGRPGEPYQAIGRGALNIENLPVLRDARGAFGTPTSDSERTMVSGQTRHFLMVVFDFGRSGLLDTCLEDSTRLYRQYAQATSIVRTIIQ
jgi:DNA/RNA-binding domain of Phe-tRNA-synthetase-like protein